MSRRLALGAVSPRERRTLLFGASAVLAIVALGRGFPAWRAALVERRENAAELTRTLAGADQALARHAALRDTLTARSRRLDAVAGTLLPAGDSGDQGAAGRALAAMVSGAAAGAEVRLTTTAVIEERRRVAPRGAVGELSGPRNPSRRDDADDTTLLRTVAVRVVGATDVRGLTTMLHTLERGPMRLRVRSLSVSQPEVAADDARVETLQVDLVVEGLAVASRPASSHVPAKPDSARGVAP
jgi:hypothetical protein